MRIMKIILLFLGIFLSSCQLQLPTAPASDNSWFEAIKLRAKESQNPTELYRLLHDMPKGGDLHNHLSGSALSHWWYDVAVAQESRGYIYYTRVSNLSCDNPAKPQSNIILYRNINSLEFNNLSSCEQTQYKQLKKLNTQEKTQWLNSIRLDKSDEGREEFFERHWQRLNSLNDNPWLKAEILYKNMQAFANEGIAYVEFQTSLTGFANAEGTPLTEDEVATIYRNRLNQTDALETGVMVRFQSDLIRFLPDAEETLMANFNFVHNNPDYWVGINMVGREDNELGQPLRFLTAMGEMRFHYKDVKISLHAGESEYANSNVKDSLAMGADRIGHGLNLIQDKETFEKMRYGSNLIEINLISNLLLNYVESYKNHPFPHFLRSGIPVALSTDDRGMWDSTMTDEFFVAVTEFDLSWDEVKLLSRNSLQHAFVNIELKKNLIANYEKRILSFEQKMNKSGISSVPGMPETRGFICRQYKVCH